MPGHFDLDAILVEFRAQLAKGSAAAMSQAKTDADRELVLAQRELEEIRVQLMIKLVEWRNRSLADEIVGTAMGAAIGSTMVNLMQNFGPDACATLFSSVDEMLSAAAGRSSGRIVEVRGEVAPVASGSA